MLTQSVKIASHEERCAGLVHTSIVQLFSEMNAVYTTYFTPKTLPARSTVEVDFQTTCDRDEGNKVQHKPLIFQLTLTASAAGSKSGWYYRN